MKRQQSSPRWVVLWVLILSLLLFLAGCGPVEVREQVPAPQTGASSGEASLPAEHDLAILAIDFDPPLDYKELWTRHDSVTLLVAVENRGLSRESEIKVTAALSDPRQGETLLKQSITLVSLAPGQVEVVRFEGVSDVVYRTAYRLEVRVAPVAGERLRVNNVRTYELTITETEKERQPFRLRLP